jgi:hypothetical protein
MDDHPVSGIPEIENDTWIEAAALLGLLKHPSTPME